MEQTLAQKMEAQLTEKLGDAFEIVVEDKNKYYQSHPEAIPTVSEIDNLVSNVALKNSAISGGASLVPVHCTYIASQHKKLLN